MLINSVNFNRFLQGKLHGYYGLPVISFKPAFSKAFLIFVLLLFFVYYLLMTAQNIQTNYRGLAQTLKGKVPGKLQLKIICYQNIMIPIFFVLVFLILYNS